MSETVINLFLDILAAVYTNFAILYFSRRLLPVRNKISLFFLLILFTLPMSLCFLMKRSTLSGEFTILIQLLILGCVFIGFGYFGFDAVVFSLSSPAVIVFCVFVLPGFDGMSFLRYL